MDGVLPGITFPRVPGHEVVGKIDSIGPGVSVGKSASASEWGFLVDTADTANRAGAVILLIAQISRSPELISTAATLK